MKAVKMGFNSNLVIHPSQIEIINCCFMPTDEVIKKLKFFLKINIE